MSVAKINSALYALHLILVRARFMAQQGDGLADLAILLDYSEALPRLLAANEDMTDKYREYLHGIVERLPYCNYILKKFDDPDPPLMW